MHLNQLLRSAERKDLVVYLKKAIAQFTVVYIVKWPCFLSWLTSDISVSICLRKLKNFRQVKPNIDTELCKIDLYAYDCVYVGHVFTGHKLCYPYASAYVTSETPAKTSFCSA